MRPHVIPGALPGTAHAGVFVERISDHFFMEEFAVSRDHPDRPIILMAGQSAHGDQRERDEPGDDEHRQSD